MKSIWRTRIWPFAREALRRWSANDGNTLAASMAYYASLSFFPLLLILISGLGFALRFAPKAQDARLELVSWVAKQTTPELGDQLDWILKGVSGDAAVHGPLGLLTLLVGAIAIFTQMTASFDRIWHANVPPSSGGVLSAVRTALRYRLKAFIALIGLGLLILAGFLAGFTLSAVRAKTSVSLGLDGWRRLELFAGVVLNTLAFATLYKVLPRAAIRWRDALCGGALAAIIWELGRAALQWLIVRSNYTAYGVVGAFIAVMLWVYYASLLLLLCAQVVQMLGYPTDAPAPEKLSKKQERALAKAKQKK